MLSQLSPLPSTRSAKETQENGETEVDPDSQNLYSVLFLIMPQAFVAWMQKNCNFGSLPVLILCQLVDSEPPLAQKPGSEGSGCSAIRYDSVIVQRG